MLMSYGFVLIVLYGAMIPNSTAREVTKLTYRAMNVRYAMPYDTELRVKYPFGTCDPDDWTFRLYMKKKSEGDGVFGDKFRILEKNE